MNNLCAVLFCILFMIAGVGIGYAHATKSAISGIAQDCRSVGAFVVNRTAFSCEVIRRATGK
jgi:hypothetical protein